MVQLLWFTNSNMWIIFGAFGGYLLVGTFRWVTLGGYLSVGNFAATANAEEHETTVNIETTTETSKEAKCWTRKQLFP